MIDMRYNFYSTEKQNSTFTDGSAMSSIRLAFPKIPDSRIMVGSSSQEARLNVTIRGLTPNEVRELPSHDWLMAYAEKLADGKVRVEIVCWRSIATHRIIDFYWDDREEEFGYTIEDYCHTETAREAERLQEVMRAKYPYTHGAVQYVGIFTDKDLNEYALYILGPHMAAIANVVSLPEPDDRKDML